MKLWYILLPACLPLAGFSQNIQFDLLVSSPEDEYIFSGIEDFDGNYILAGSIGNDSDYYSYRAYLLKISDEGDTLLTKKFPDSLGTTAPGKILQTADSNYVLLGTLVDFDTLGTFFYCWIAKTDKDFNILWSKTYYNPAYNGNYTAFINGIIDSNGDIVAVGQATPFDSLPGMNILVYRLSQQGDSLHSVDIPGSFRAYDILEMPPSGSFIVFAGIEDSTNNWYRAAHLDSMFNIQGYIGFPWQWVFGTNISAMQLTDTTYMITSGYDPDEPLPWWLSRDAGVMILNINDSVMYENNFGKIDTADAECRRGLDFVYKDAIYIGGSSNVDITYPGYWFAPRQTWIMLNKLDSAGALIWQRYYGGDANYDLTKVLATSDGGCLLIASRYDYITANGDERDIYILKIGTDTTVSIRDNSTLSTRQSYKIYPNPTSSTFTIQGSFALPATIKLYDLTGRQVYRQAVTSNLQQVNVGNLTAGLYIYRLISDGKAGRGKLIIE